MNNYYYINFLKIADSPMLEFFIIELNFIILIKSPSIIFLYIFKLIRNE